MLIKAANTGKASKTQSRALAVENIFIYFIIPYNLTQCPFV